MVVGQHCNAGPAEDAKPHRIGKNSAGKPGRFADHFQFDLTLCHYEGRMRRAANHQGVKALHSYPNPRHAVLLMLAGGLMLSGTVSAFAQVTGTGPTINKKEMPGYCRNMAIEMFGVKPNKVKLKKLVEGTNVFSVPGAADQGANGTRAFQCTFDAEGRFIKMSVETQGGE